MIYSSACEYAIRASVHLASRDDDALVKVRDIAAAEGIPAPFLSSILQRLVGAGLLRSARGPAGGYALAKPADAIVLHDIKVAVDGAADLEACAAGLGACTDETPCPLHDAWKPIRERIQLYLKETTLERMAEALAAKRKAARGTVDGTGSGQPRGGGSPPRSRPGPRPGR